MSAPAETNQRGYWGSGLGFVLAVVGSVIGLGNIWRFPTEAGQNGGGAFVLVYVIATFLIGVPVMLAELALGRKTQRNPVGAYRSLAPGSGWGLAGGLGVLTGLIILSYYSVVAGWTLKYVWVAVSGSLHGATPEAIGATFNGFIQDPVAVLICHLLFMLLTIRIVMGGIQGGIERAAKILMPVLFGLLLLLVARSLTLPGASEGLRFYLKPDFGKLDVVVILKAVSQAFFSLSLGMGAIITYGSYLSPKQDLVSSALYVSFFDFFIAFLAGLAIFPALFSVPGLSPDVGPGLIFVVLPNIFNAIPLGNFFGAAFFILLGIAALTSAISMLEVVVAFTIDEFGWTRRRAAIGAGSVIFLLGIPSALGNGAVVFFSGTLDFANQYFGGMALVVGALLVSLFVGWKWGIGNAVEELERGRGTFRLGTVWGFLIRFVCPLAILTILFQLLRG
jgi:NSS family neurotransmitter:Na+ symporter